MNGRRDFIKDAGLLSIGLGLLPSFFSFTADNVDKPFVLPRSTPEMQGISSDGIMKFLDAIKENNQEFHSLMILRHGHVVTEGCWSPYLPGDRHQLYSLSKSFTGTAIGLAVSEGLLTVNDPVIKFFPDLLPAQISDNLANLQVKHLLSMSVGHAKDSVLTLEASPAGVPWEKTFLSIPVANAPGTQFLYNSGASFMLSAIIKKLTGMAEQEYLKPRLYQPLDIVGSSWTENWEGINMGASDLRIHIEDIAKFGQLYLQKGMWNGKQVISSDWVAEASAKHISNGNNDGSWAYGYGYQFWLNPPGGFRADGAFGQFSMILPELDAVVAIAGENTDTKTTMQMVWDILLPEMKAAALPEDKSSHGMLLSNLRDLKIDPPQLAVASWRAAKIEGKEFILDSNPFKVKSIGFHFSGDTCVFTLKEDGKADIVLTHGFNRWIRKGNFKPSAHSLFSLRRIDFDSPVAASACWQDDKTLLLTWRYIEAVHTDSIACTFDEDKVNIKFLFSINKKQGKPDDRGDITGHVLA